MTALSPAAKVVLRRRLQQDEAGTVVETPDEMMRRVATQARPEAQFGDRVGATEGRFYDVMQRLYFPPNSPTFMNAGTEPQHLTACSSTPHERRQSDAAPRVHQRHQSLRRGAVHS